MQARRQGPYVIGLTGGICSGKSHAVDCLADLGAVVVDCDKLGHAAYAKGTACFDEFGTFEISRCHPKEAY